MFPNLFQIYSKLTTLITVIVHVTHNLFELLLVKAKQFIKHSPTLDPWPGIIYLVIINTDVSYMCFKNIAKLHIQSNNLPQIWLNV